MALRAGRHEGDAWPSTEPKIASGRLRTAAQLTVGPIEEAGQGSGVRVLIILLMSWAGVLLDCSRVDSQLRTVLPTLFRIFGNIYRTRVYGIRRFRSSRCQTTANHRSPR